MWSCSSAWPAVAEDADETGRRARTPRQRLVRAAKTLLVVATLALAGRVVAHQWAGVRDGLGTLSVGWTSLSAAFALAALVAIALSWREVLADLGSALPLPTALRIFLLAQLGKYLPGGVFALAGQMEVASRYGVSRARAAAASVVTLWLGIAMGGLVGLGALALLPRDLAGPFLPALLLVPLAGLLHPRPLNALINRGLALLRRPPLEHSLSVFGTGRALCWSAASWLLLGLHVWALCRDVGATQPVLALAITGFAAAWLIGFVVVIAPAGFGVREAVLVAVLGGSLAAGSSAAIVVAGVSRLLLVVCDIVLAGLGLLLGSSPERHRREARS